MTEFTAGDLPDGSIVVDDLKGIVYYAGGDGTHRWFRASDGEYADSVVDYAIKHGATVVRAGDDVGEADRYQTEARNAATTAGRRLRLLANIHSLLRAGRVDEAIGVIVGEAEQSPGLADLIGIRRIR
jgi:hypothetical protein